MEIKKKKYVGCYGIVINDKNETLLIKKAGGAYKGKLDLPGGGIEYGESPEETLKREFIEEVGVGIEEFNLFTVKTNYQIWSEQDYKENLQHIAIIYKVKIKNNDLNKIKVTADGCDSLGANWYDINKLNLEDLSPFARIVKEPKI